MFSSTAITRLSIPLYRNGVDKGIDTHPAFAGTDRVLEKTFVRELYGTQSEVELNELFETCAKYTSTASVHAS